MDRPSVEAQISDRMTGVPPQEVLPSDSVSSTSIPMTPQSQISDPFEPCASTASLFLFAQGPVILSLHHDTLAVERHFTRHSENIDFISVDNVSERGAGRLVVSYDVGQTAIVWDLFTGSEISRFASCDHLRVAAWMRNGTVAFGEFSLSLPIQHPATDTIDRKWEGGDHLVRTFHVRAQVDSHHFRPYHCSRAIIGLSDARNRVGGDAKEFGVPS